MPAIPISRFESELLAVHRAKDHAPSTLRQIAQVLRELRDVGVSRTSHLDGAAIARWKQAHPERTPVTLRSHLRCLRAMCGRAVKLGYLRANPLEIDPINEWVRDDAPTAKPKRQWAVGPPEIRRVLAQADKEASAGGWAARRLRAYVWCLLTLGMRPAELQRLETWDFDQTRRTITIRAKWVPVSGKGDRWWRPKTVGSAATIPVGERTSAVLVEWIPETGCRWLFPGTRRLGPWTCGGPGVRPLDQVKALGERCKTDVDAAIALWQKSGRKSVGTHARAAGMSKSERQGLFRHADEETGDHYDEGDVEGLRPAVERLERYFLGLPDPAAPPGATGT